MHQKQSKMWEIFLNSHHTKKNKLRSFKMQKNFNSRHFAYSQLLFGMSRVESTRCQKEMEY